MATESPTSADWPTTMITVTALHTYPVKSCAGVSLQHADITPRGLEHDRDFMIVGDDSGFLSQRQIPAMALIVPSVGDDALTLTAPGMDPLRVPLRPGPGDPPPIDATVHGHAVVGQPVGAAADAWFTRFLPPYKENRSFRLLRVREEQPRAISERYREDGASNQIGFADGQPILLASEPSLAQLNTELDEPVPMNRFRPNIVIDGPGLPAYEEDYWTRIRVGAMDAFVAKACDRCSIPDVDQATAATGKVVRRALLTRRGVNAHDETNGGVFFAQNINHVPAPGLTLHVGDTVTVLARAAHPNVVLRQARSAGRAA
jgi:uncharacterized protein